MGTETKMAIERHSRLGESDIVLALSWAPAGGHFRKARSDGWVRSRAAPGHWESGEWGGTKAAQKIPLRSFEVKESHLIDH